MLRRDALKIMGGAVLLPSLPAPKKEEPIFIPRTPLKLRLLPPYRLKMWHNGIDTVIAENIDEARLLVAKTYFGETACPGAKQGEPNIWGFHITTTPRSAKFMAKFPNATPTVMDGMNDIYYDEVDGYGNWTHLLPGQTFTLWDYHPTNETTKPVQEWIDEHGKGYFASTEY